VWLLARRSLSDPKQLAYYLAYVPPRTSLAAKVRVASSRYTVEQCIEEAKGETGLDDYEVRFWHSWYRHITLSMMAHAWLASIRLQEQGKKVREQMSLLS
jgi:SRSO17 transposase